MNCLIKVGKVSKIKLRNCNVIRAITFNELSKKSLNNDIDIMVIEEANETDRVKIEKSIEQYDRNKVILFNCVCSVDGVISVNSLKSLQETISELCGVDVRTYDVVVGEIAEDTESSVDSVDNNVENLNRDSDNNESTDESVEIDLDSTEGDVESTENDVVNELSKETAEYYEEQLSKANDKIKYFRDLAENTKVDYDRVVKKLKELVVSSDVVEYMSSTADEKELSKQVNELKEYKEKYEKANELIQQLNESESTSSSEIKDLNEEIIKLNDEINSEIDARLEACRIVKEVCWSAWKIESEYSNKCKELGELLAKIKETEDRYKELSDKCESSNALAAENEKVLTEQVEQLSVRLTETLDELESASEKVMSKDSIIQELEEEIQKLKDDIQSLSDANEKRSTEIVEQNNELARFKSINIEEMEETIRALQESNSALAGEVGKSKRDKDEYERQLEEAKIQMANLKQYNDKISTTAKSLARNSDAGEMIRINCEYTGKAFIIQVFGSGSYGVTSISEAIANSLPGKVLIIDLDIVNPKLDNWYNISPIANELSDISNQMKKTGIGALLEKGVDYVINNKDIILKRVRDNRSIKNTVDYMSGSYSKIDMFKLMSINFSEFFTYFGNEYDYIVIDSGRLGASEVSNAIIRMINNIAFRNVVVTLHQTADCRTMALRMQAEKISGEKTVWVLNMAKDRNVTSVMKKSVRYAIDNCAVGFDKSTYGEVCDLDKNSGTKGDIRRIVDTIVR